jgi:hypothetical protein
MAVTHAADVPQFPHSTMINIDLKPYATMPYVDLSRQWIQRT